MGGCSSCCTSRGRSGSVHLISSGSPEKKLAERGANTTNNPLLDEKLRGELPANGLVIGSPIIPIWALQILPSPSFLKGDNSTLDAIIVVEEPQQTSTPLGSEEGSEDLDMDFELPELMGPAGDNVLEAKGTSMTLSPTRVEILEIERQLSNTPLPPDSNEEVEKTEEPLLSEGADNAKETRESPDAVASDNEQLLPDPEDDNESEL